MPKSETATDQYATRHNPFVYFHSIIDNTRECNANVVPLGKLLPSGSPDLAGPNRAQSAPTVWLRALPEELAR